MMKTFARAVGKNPSKHQPGMLCEGSCVACVYTIVIHHNKPISGSIARRPMRENSSVVAHTLSEKTYKCNFKSIAEYRLGWSRIGF